MTHYTEATCRACEGEGFHFDYIYRSRIRCGACCGSGVVELPDEPAPAAPVDLLHQHLLNLFPR